MEVIISLLVTARADVFIEEQSILSLCSDYSLTRALHKTHRRQKAEYM